MGAPLKVQLGNETWVWYAVGVVSLLARYWAQWLRNKSWKGFRSDDALMFFCFGCYTTMIVCLNKYSDINLDFADQTPEQASKNANFAGILNVLIETCEVTALYGVKACFLILYYRLTSQLGQQKIVTGTSVLCALAYIATIVCLYGGFCHPFHEYFIPTPTNIQCLTWFKYNVLELTLNVSTDLLIIGIPISVVWNSGMNMPKKIGLCAVFSLGIFVILAACLTKYFVFTTPLGAVWVLWYSREGSMAIIVGNMVLWHPLLLFIFQKTAIMFTPLSSFISSRRGSSKSASSTSDDSVRTAVDIEAQKGASTVVRGSNERMSVEEEEMV